MAPTDVLRMECIIKCHLYSCKDAFNFFSPFIFTVQKWQLDAAAAAVLYR